MKYRFEKVEDPQKWDEFVRISPQGTIYSEYDYLKSTKADFELYFIYSREEVRAGVSLVCTGDGYGLDDMVIYNGLMFAPPHANQKQNGIYSEQFKITEFFVTQMDQREKKLVMSLSPELQDMRPYLWLNYHADKTARRFRIDIRYTSILSIEELCFSQDVTETQLFNNMDAKRRQSLRRAWKKGAVVRQSDDVDLLLQFYCMTFEKQGKAVPGSKLQQMKSVTNWALANKRGFLFVASNEKGEDTSLALFIHDKHRAYYMFGANNYKLRDDYSGTLVLWEAFVALAKEGIGVVDLEGVNSPERGWFKLSFGGDLRTYYEVSL